MRIFSWKRFSMSLSIPIRIGVLMVLIFVLQESFNLDFGILGILPREIFGLFGVILSPFIHGNFFHLFSNLLPFTVLSVVLYYFYDRIAGWVLVYGMLFTNLLVWLAGRPQFHIGSSGVVYMLAFFLMGFGFFRWTLREVLLSITVMLVYGSLFYGIFPGSERVSWESHLLGALVGIVLSGYLSRKKHVSSLRIASNT